MSNGSSERIWRCDCGGAHFVSIAHHDWKDGTGEVFLVVEDFVGDGGHWGRLRACWNLLRHRRHTWHTVLLTSETVNEIIAELNAHRDLIGRQTSE